MEACFSRRRRRTDLHCGNSSDPHFDIQALPQPGWTDPPTDRNESLIRVAPRRGHDSGLKELNMRKNWNESTWVHGFVTAYLSLESLQNVWKTQTHFCRSTTDFSTSRPRNHNLSGFLWDISLRWDYLSLLHICLEATCFAIKKTSCRRRNFFNNIA
jgi:hypothetical protein